MIRTHTGREIDPFAPVMASLHLDDIAHALSNLCRFTGHTSRFYSVAEHCVHVSRLVPPEDRVAALLHDAAEAYLNDIATPVKSRPEMAPYRAAEDRLLEMVLLNWVGRDTLPESVKRADEAMLHLEAAWLMRAPWAVPELAAPAGFVLPLPCWSPEEAREAFALELRHQLTRPTPRPR